MGCKQSKIQEKPLPEDFPAGIEGHRRRYESLDGTMIADDVIFVEPTGNTQVIQMVNWAAQHGFKVRATGRKHTLCPITISTNTMASSFDASFDLGRFVLLDLRPHMNHVQVLPARDGLPPMARVQLGCTLVKFLEALERAPGGGPDHLGYGVTHAPAAAEDTIGGILATDGHGSCIPVPADNGHLNVKQANWGTFSNRMLACHAVVFDQVSRMYTIKEFHRESGDEIGPFMAHVGKALLVDATLQVEPNYHLRCESIMNIDWRTLFNVPGSAIAGSDEADEAAGETFGRPLQEVRRTQDETKRFDALLRRYGRVEATWIPFTQCPWVKVWEVTGSQQPEGTRLVTEPCNYPSSENTNQETIAYYRSLTHDHSAESGSNGSTSKKDEKHREKQESAALGSLIQDAHVRLDTQSGRPRHHETHGPGLANWLGRIEKKVKAFQNNELSDQQNFHGNGRWTPDINALTWMRIFTGLYMDKTWNIWGPSKNVLVHTSPHGMQTVSNGYAIMTKLENLQHCLTEFIKIYKGLLDEYELKGEFPVSQPLEIRVTNVDDPETVALGPDIEARTPPLSAVSIDADARKQGWNVALWIDALAVPGTRASNDFYMRLETLLLRCDVLNGLHGRLRPEWSKGWGYTEEGPWTNSDFFDLVRQRYPEWNKTIAQLSRHDPRKLFTNPWMDRFFTRAKVSHIYAGETMMPGHEIRSPNGKYRLVLQQDGALVVYEGADHTVWSTQTAGEAITHALMTHRGKLMLLNGRTRVWASQQEGAERICLDDDGQLHGYDGQLSRVFTVTGEVAKKDSMSYGHHRMDQSGDRSGSRVNQLRNQYQRQGAILG